MTYWLAIVGLTVVSAIAAGRLLWTSRKTRGEHANYDPAFSVLAVAARIVRESAVRNANDQRPMADGSSG